MILIDLHILSEANKESEIQSDENINNQKHRSDNFDPDTECSESDRAYLIFNVLGPLNFGTFFLQQRPVEYVMARPLPEEFSRSRPRALWKLAIEATLLVIRRHRLTPEFLSERRRTREAYIRLLLLQERRWSGLSSAEAQKWTSLIKGIHPTDLYLWRCIAHFRIAQERQRRISRECREIFHQ